MATLLISMTFLSDTYHGKEWPPAPMRLFQAMIAGYQQGRPRITKDVPLRTALQWLEQLPPPDIQACEAALDRVCRMFVPNNDDDIAMARWATGKPESPNDKARRYTEKRRQPWRLEADRSVHYLWQIPSGEEPLAQAVAQYANDITTLGWGIDMVVGQGHVLPSEPSLPGLVYQPHVERNNGRVLRVPCLGSYASAERRYQALTQSGRQGGGLSFTKPPLAYRQVAYRQKREPSERRYTCFQLLTLDGRRNYRRDPRQAIAIAAMLRHAVHEVLQRENYTLSQIQDLMGHGQRHRQMTFLPLPSIGHPQADGLIRRAMLNIPNSAILRRLQWALDGHELQADGNPVAMLSLIEGRDTVVERFTGGSHLWETVTPVVLPGYDQCGASKWKTEKLIHRALRQSGFALPEVQDIWYQPAPWHRHGHRAGAYRVADYMRYPQYHVRVRFQNPVKGPVALGAGRYFGLGLMAGVAEV